MQGRIDSGRLVRLRCPGESETERRGLCQSPDRVKPDAAKVPARARTRKTLLWAPLRAGRSGGVLTATVRVMHSEGNGRGNAPRVAFGACLPPIVRWGCASHVWPSAGPMHKIAKNPLHHAYRRSRGGIRRSLGKSARRDHRVNCLIRPSHTPMPTALPNGTGRLLSGLNCRALR